MVLLTYRWGDGFDPQTYMTAHLSQPLQAGVEYCLSLQASLVDRATFRTNTLSCHFSQSYPNICAGEDSLQWSALSQIVWNTANVDSVNWSLLQGSFVAAGGEEYLTIGNWCTYYNCDTVFLGWQGPPFSAAYYIDDVVLQDCQTSVGELGAEAIKLYPNPASEQINIEVPRVYVGGTAELLNSLGSVVMSRKVTNDKVSLDISTFGVGMYLVRLTTANGRGMRIMPCVLQH